MAFLAVTVGTSNLIRLALSSLEESDVLYLLLLLLLLFDAIAVSRVILLRKLPMKLSNRLCCTYVNDSEDDGAQKFGRGVLFF